ncbi:dienelactone hydrolase family protein [Leptolyngbya cf. ectocarpi LEGE 11479]|uniref:Dienelactone hydrolase family protein n=1 Tax=Leptolyngbya cf. ectocarpi LEGE 11479 TaxID=1828722 RepID=A0A928ZXH6_LEPEC|nr:dienelactone hydrolase family protein [Leptolyngbya ectocarpi]MBE9069210.1 dienelactone hydrolase family protein [Leptolyngbya cf. ectocarpi LEGE 11479]
MTTPEIATNTIEVQSGDITLPVYVAIPDGKGPFGAVIVLQEIFGVNSHIRDVTERIAREGYVALAPALYHRQAPGFETGYTPEDIQVGRRYKVQTRADELLSDIQATIDYAKTLPQVKDGGVGCIGFCFGGHVAYLAATLKDTVAIASFYGAGIPDTAFGPGPVALDRTAHITGTLHCFFGTEDASIPAEAVTQIRTALQQSRIDYQIFEYEGAGHGFFCDRRGSYNANAAADAWEKVKQLFTDKLA